MQPKETMTVVVYCWMPCCLHTLLLAQCSKLVERPTNIGTIITRYSPILIGLFCAQVREDTEELKNLRLEKEKLERLLLLEKEEAEKLLLEKEEIERERNMLLREIDSKDENMSKLLEVLTSVQGKDRENVKMRMKTEAENRSLNRKIRIIEKEKRSLKNQLQTEKGLKRSVKILYFQIHD